MGKIFNVSSSNCFVEILAEKLLNDYQNNILELSKVLILLPNRRAQRSLSDAFVKLNGMTPTLLPQMRAIGDVSEDEIMLSGQNTRPILSYNFQKPQCFLPMFRIFFRS